MYKFVKMLIFVVSRYLLGGHLPQLQTVAQLRLGEERVHFLQAEGSRGRPLQANVGSGGGPRRAVRRGPTEGAVRRPGVDRGGGGGRVDWGMEVVRRKRGGG